MDDEVGVGPRVGVGAEVDAGDDAAGDGEPITADRVANGANFGVELGHAADGEVDETFEGSWVIQADESEVAIVGDVGEGGGELASRVTLGDQDTARIGDDVGVGEDLVGSDEKAGAIATGKPACIPRGAVVGVLSGDFDTEDGLSLIHI